MKCREKTLLAVGMVVAVFSGPALAAPEPGEVCSKEGASIYLPYGDTMTCREGKYVATVLGEIHHEGAACWGSGEKKLKPNKFGMACKNGKFKRVEASK